MAKCTKWQQPKKDAGAVTATTPCQRCGLPRIDHGHGSNRERPGRTTQPLAVSRR